MPLIIPSSFVSPLQFSPCCTYTQPKFPCNSFSPYPFKQRMFLCCKTRCMYTNIRNQPNVLHKYALKSKGYYNESPSGETTMSLDMDDDDEEEIEDTGSPWVGAVIYKRNTSTSHLEYCTTLESLGLGNLSTEVSKTRASVMGLRVTKSVKDFPNGTPVQISIDVTRKRKKLRLDGIIKTVIGLLCNRCGMPSAECIFSEFSLLLTEEPIAEPETIDMGVIFGEDKFTPSGNNGEDDDDALIDLDDQLYFPLQEKEIDISKNIRDRVHIEITMNSICDPGCKGLCLKCGQNLNTGNCGCSKQEVKEKSLGPLGHLKEQMQL